MSIDITIKLPLVPPQRVVSPTLLVRGQYDGIATIEVLVDFCGKLRTVSSASSPMRSTPSA